MSLGTEQVPVPYRQSVGNTSQWKRAHRYQIYRMVNPTRLMLVYLATDTHELDTFDILVAIQKATKYGSHKRGKPVRWSTGT